MIAMGENCKVKEVKMSMELLDIIGGNKYDYLKNVL